VPKGYETDGQGAYEFLNERALELEQAGFGVLLPAWWTRKGTKQKLSVKGHATPSKFESGARLSIMDIVNFEWEIAIGDHVLSLEELMTLAKLKSPLVKVRGQWVQMSAEEIQTALDFWKQEQSATGSVRDAIRMALGSTDHTRGLEISSIEGKGWLADLLGRLNDSSSLEELKCPKGFDGTLRPYQLRGFSWLAFLRQWGLGACLADDMGLGKTIQALALILRDWNPKKKRPVLLVCPTSVIGNWRKEAERFTPKLPVMVHHGSTRTKDKGFAKEASRHAIVISSYALLYRDLSLLQEVDWAGIILDEAQNIKNAGTRQAKAARALQAEYRIALTGTPVENSVGDLWSLMEFLNPGLLGGAKEFEKNFLVPIQVKRDPETTDRLKGITSPFILRRLKTDKSIIADLPDKIEMKVYCTLTREQASLYAAVVQELDKSLDKEKGIKRKGMVLACISKLKQICNHPAQFLGDNSSIPKRSGKLARLTEMLEEITEAGDKALVFSQFAEMGEIVRKHVEASFGREALFLHGSLSKKKRDEMVARFQSGDGPSVFILSLKAGGVGLNLTKANHVFHSDRWWNPAVEDQATDRAFRIGQTKNVQVHKFLCAGTFEESIDEMIEHKRSVADKVVGTGEAWLTEMSTEDLRKVLTLRENAVEE